MDAALKQRLVGASVIIALAVIFIPMIFDDSNRTQNQSISIKIPDEPTDLKHKTLSLDSPTEISNEQASNESISVSNQIDAKSPITKQETILEVVDNSQNKNEQKNITTEPVKQKETASKEKQSKQETIKPQQEDSKTKPVQNVVKEQAVDTKQARYRVKLGSFSSQKNAQQLKAKILNNGFKALVEKDGESGLYKVFSNQVNSQALADEMNAQIQKLKLKIGKTSVEKLSATAQDEAELQLDSGWILQIGSFAGKENSLKLRDKIRKKGFVSFVDETYNTKKQRRFRVRIGPYATREEALLEQNKIKKSMNLKSLIKPHEKQRVIN